MYHSVEQARMRLSECIVKLKGEFVYVLNIEEDEEGMHLITQSSGKPKEPVLRTLINKECGLDPRPVKLGYINTVFGWKYCYRVPKRRWKQGLHSSNLSSSDNLLLKRVFNSPEMLACLNNEYLTLKQVLKAGEGAFSRYFLIEGGELYYRGTLVGTASQENGLIFSDKYKYLKEQLERALL